MLQKLFDHVCGELEEATGDIQEVREEAEEEQMDLLISKSSKGFLWIKGKSDRKFRTLMGLFT